MWLTLQKQAIAESNTKAIAEMKSDTEQKMKLKQLYKVGSECKLNSLSDSLVCQSVWTEFGGRGFKSHNFLQPLLRIV